MQTINWMHDTKVGAGKHDMTYLFDSNISDEHNEYATIAEMADHIS